MPAHSEAMMSRSRAQLFHQLVEAHALLLANEVRRRHPHVGEEQLAGVLAVLTDLLQNAAPLKAL